MDAILLCSALKQRSTVMKRNAQRRRRAAKRRYLFLRRQSNERLVFVCLLSLALLRIQSPVRSVWMKERSNDWWERIVWQTFSSYDWMENFRMSRETFVYVCNEVRELVKKENTSMRDSIPTEQRVAIALWYLSSGSDFRTISHLFGISKSTVCLVVKEVCNAIVQVLLPKYIKWPTGESLTDTIHGFERKWGFPQCAGAIDGTHIPIISPEYCPADYFNRKGWHSIIMQGVVNHLGQFTDVYVGWPGRVHDARVLVNSNLFHKGTSGTLFPDSVRRICGKDVPIVLIGDPAYPLLPWLIKAFPDNGSLSQQQRTFNYRLSNARVIVEHSYGRLKGRWRCLLKRIDVDIGSVPTLVSACTVLHNICEIHGERFDDEWLDGVGNDGVQSNTTTNYSNDGVTVRDTLMNYFSEE